MSDCQRPMEVIKRVLGQNFGEVQSNIQACTRDCEKINTETNHKDVDYACIQNCLESNLAILKELDKRLNDNLLIKKDEIFM